MESSDSKGSVEIGSEVESTRSRSQPNGDQALNVSHVVSHACKVPTASWTPSAPEAVDALRTACIYSYAVDHYARSSQMHQDVTHVRAYMNFLPCGTL